MLHSLRSKKEIAPEEIAEKVADIRREGKKIVTLNGSFDLLHAGHLEIIYQASLQGDCLIVMVNSDQSIQQYKGPLRPIIPLKYRLRILSAIECIDYVTWFEELDPRQILSKVRPDVHVNGSEYGKNCIEASVVKEGGGRIHIVDLVPGLSTSSIIKKIVETCG